MDDFSETGKEHGAVGLSVVAPVYNEQPETLRELVRRTSDVALRIVGNFEIILVDDGSRNDAWAAIVALTREMRQVRGIRLARNFGQHAAISAGIDHARGDWVVVMDSDLQDRPEVIPELYAKAQQGYDVVLVNRLRRPEGAIYLLFSSIFYAVLNFLAGDSYNRLQGNFSMISGEVVRAFRSVPDRDKFYGGTVRWLGFRSATIDAQHGNRFSGQSTYNIRGRFRFAWRLIVGHSTRLLSLAMLFGVLMALLSFIMGMVIIANKLSHPDLPIPGWPSVMTAVFFAAGITNVMLGFIGVYLGELFNWSKGRPRYVVSQIAVGRKGAELGQPHRDSRPSDSTQLMPTREG